MSWVTVAGENRERPAECARQAGRVGVACLRLCPAPRPPSPRPKDGTGSAGSTRGGGGAGGGCCVPSVRYADPEHPLSPFFFCFHFYKGKGGLSGEQPHAT